LFRFVGASDRLGDHTVESRAFEAAEPIGGDFQILRRWGEMNRRRNRFKHRFERRATTLERLAAQIPVAFA